MSFKILSLKNLEEFLKEQFTEELLSIEDYTKNGLIIRGSEQIDKILFSTSISLELIKYAAKHGFNAIITHHGFFGKQFISFNDYIGERLKLLYQNNISFFGYHLPLDMQKQFGNNACLLRFSGLELDYYYNIGIIAKNPLNLSLSQISQNITHNLNKKLNYELQDIKIKQQSKDLNVFLPRIEYSNIIYDYTQNTTQKIFICSGGAQSFIPDAIKQGCDLMILGSMEEYNIPVAQENNLSIILLGHHRSETCGIQCLMEEVQNKLKVKCEFIAFDNIL